MKTATVVATKNKNLTAVQVSQIRNLVATATNAKVCFATKESVVVVATNIEAANMLAHLVASYKSLSVGKIERYLNVRTGNFLFGFTVLSNK